MFIDEVTIKVIAGRGGDGVVSFRREKYVPFGGPDGGDGGDGGSIYLEADEGYNTLSHLRYNKLYKAPSGEPGRGNNCYGKTGQDLIIKVPVGTIVRKNGKIIGDLTSHQERCLVAKGGRGGRGNAKFAGPRNQTPRFAERGESGEEAILELELKVLADVGLVGFPNAGKSTFLSKISAARPKVADYPFTTLNPVLGVVDLDEHSFVVADLPGLISGAHQGAGLGIAFLKHVERTRLLLHLVDLSADQPWEDFTTINKELAGYSQELTGKPQIVVGTKIDLPEAAAKQKEFTERIANQGYEVICISAVTGENVKQLLYLIADRLKKLPRISKIEINYEQTLPGAEPVFTIEREEDGAFRITGEQLLKKIARFNPDQDEALLRLDQLLKRHGVLTALENEGVKEGDLIRIGHYEFIYRL